MKDIRLSEEAKNILVKAYGKDSIKINKELDELGKLSVKRKNAIQAFNKGNPKAMESYVKIDEEIKKIIKQINIILSA